MPPILFYYCYSCGFNSVAMNYNCVIVEDDPLAIKILTRYLEAVPQLELSGCCSDGIEAMHLMDRKNVDLLFLDVQLPKLPGPDLVRTLPHPPYTIFTTAHPEFAVEAFDLGAVDYLIKPFSFERFLKAVNRFYRTNNIRKPRNSSSLPDFLCFRTERKMVRVPLDNILYIESLKDYIVIHRINEPDLRVKQTINCVEQLLPRNSFVRIHRSFIVPVNRITAYTNHHLEVGKVEIPIGRKYKGKFPGWEQRSLI